MYCWVKRYLVSKSRCWTKIFSPLLMQALITSSSQHNHVLQIINHYIITSSSPHDHIIILITFTGGGDHPGDDGWKELGLIWLCSQLCILLSTVLCIVFCILLFIVLCIVLCNVLCIVIVLFFPSLYCTLYCILYSTEYAASLRSLCRLK